MKLLQLTLITFVVLGGCKQRTGAGLKITNGVQAESKHQYPAVVQIATAIADPVTHTYSGSFIWCTAVWVSDRVVLTAERCVNDPIFGKLKNVTITAGSMAGRSPSKIVYQSEIGPQLTLNPQDVPSKNALGLAALIFDAAHASSYHVPVADVIAHISSDPVKIIGYPKEQTASTVAANTILKYEGTNKLLYAVPFLELEADDAAKGPGTSLAVEGDMGGPMFQNKNLAGIVVDYEARPTGKAHFNRYVNLAEGAGHDFLVKVQQQNEVTIRNLDGIDLFKTVVGGDLDYKPYEQDIRNGSSKTPGQNPPTNAITTSNVSTMTSANGLVAGTYLVKSAAFNAGLLKAQKMSAASGKDQRVILLFSATWCGHCQMVHNSLLPSVQSFLSNEVFVDLDLDSEPAAARAYLISSIPEFIIVNSKGAIKMNANQQLMRKVGYQDPMGFIAWVNSAQNIK